MLTTRAQVKVLDFGLAKVMREKALPESEARDGDPRHSIRRNNRNRAYMVAGAGASGSADGRSDIFSYGVVLYEILSGRRPFEAKSTAEVISAILTQEPAPLRGQASAVPERLERLIRKCLEKETRAAIQTMEELAVIWLLSAAIASWQNRSLNRRCDNRDSEGRSH